MHKSLRSLLLVLLALTTLAGTTVASATPTAQPKAPTRCPGTTFTDVASSNVFCADISWAVHQGVVTGYTDGTFRPNAPVTRGALAAVLYRQAAKQSALPSCTEAPFTDVPVSSAFCGAIADLKRRGVVLGQRDGTFHPADAVSRQEAAALLYRAAKANAAGCTSKPFPDVPTGSPFCTAIDWLVRNKITRGYSDGRFHPTDVVTRGTVVAFLHRLSGVSSGGPGGPGGGAGQIAGFTPVTEAVEPDRDTVIRTGKYELQIPAGTVSARTTASITSTDAAAGFDGPTADFHVNSDWSNGSKTVTVTMPLDADLAALGAGYAPVLIHFADVNNPTLMFGSAVTVDRSAGTISADVTSLSPFASFATALGDLTNAISSGITDASRVIRNAAASLLGAHSAKPDCSPDAGSAANTGGDAFANQTALGNQPALKYCVQTVAPSTSRPAGGADWRLANNTGTVLEVTLTGGTPSTGVQDGFLASGDLVTDALFKQIYTQDGRIVLAPGEGVKIFDPAGSENDINVTEDPTLAIAALILREIDSFDAVVSDPAALAHQVANCGFDISVEEASLHSLVQCAKNIILGILTNVGVKSVATAAKEIGRATLILDAAFTLNDSLVIGKTAMTGTLQYASATPGGGGGGAGGSGGSSSGSFTVTPTSGPTGTFITVNSVTPCTPYGDPFDNPQATVTVVDPNGVSESYPGRYLPPANSTGFTPDGTWSSGRLPIALGAPAGDLRHPLATGVYTVSAVCDGGSRQDPNYSSVNFNAGQPLQFGVSATTVNPNDSIDISQIDSCPHGASTVDAQFYIFSPDGSYTALGSQSEPVASDGQWQDFTATVPDTDYATISLDLTCSDAHGPLLNYRPRTITIIGGV